MAEDLFFDDDELTLDRDDDIIIDPDQASWDTLINAIIEGDVIPVIGNDVLVDDGNLHLKLINKIGRKCGIEPEKMPTSFSDLMHNDKFLTAVRRNPDTLYSTINQFFAGGRNVAPSELLQELLSIKQFPFVITTSFTPVVEGVMRQVWGDKLQVMRFSNNPKENHDINGPNDMGRPTVYYMFGRVGDAAHRYVLSDTDMLHFCEAWLADTDRRPGLLVSQLKRKYLLMIGNTYNDWLFRFIWFSIRKDSVQQGLYTGQQQQDRLQMFLERNSTFIRENPREVVEQIKRRLKERLKTYVPEKFNTVQDNADVFISYSRSDSEIALRLYEELTRLGMNVWYDRKNITNGGRFMDEIYHGIRTARYFVPILTSNIEREKNDSHVYRNEWDAAIDVGKSLGRTYIIPLCEEGFDFYRSSVPDRMQQHNAVMFNSVDDIERVAAEIVQTMKSR